MDAEWIARIARQEAEKTIADHMISSDHMPYFAPAGDRLITYSYYREMVQAFSSEINALERRLMRLERPWWRRWFR